jgi:mannose-6-phosphate isomerase-like protein (cupin superfamily)
MTATISPTGLLPDPQPDLRPSGAVLSIVPVPTTAPCTVARFLVPPGVTTAADCHEVRELWIVESGAGVLTLDGVPDRLRAGQTRFFDSFRTHQLHNDGSEAIELISVWWKP